MSEQSTNGPPTSNAPSMITSGVKEKNPKRVAAGKRLGANSKQAKEAKRLERQAQPNAEMEVDNKYTLYFVGGLVVVGTVSYLYINKNKLISDKKRLPTIPEEEEPPPKRLPPSGDAGKIIFWSF